MYNGCTRGTPSFGPRKQYSIFGSETKNQLAFDQENYEDLMNNESSSSVEQMRG